MDKVKRHWQDSGTKILGWIIGVVGFIGSLDSVTTGAMSKMVGPVWGGRIALICLICAGVAVKLRGNKNTGDIAEAVVSRASVGQVQASADVVTSVAKVAVAADDKAEAIAKTAVASEDVARSVSPTPEGPKT